MNPLLRALWNRLLPPGGDVAVAREPRPRRAHWLGYRPEPRRLADGRPGLDDTDECDRCWWWDPDDYCWKLCGWAAGDLWLPYSAIADPSAEP